MRNRALSKHLAAHEYLLRQTWVRHAYRKNHIKNGARSAPCIAGLNDTIPFICYCKHVS